MTRLKCNYPGCHYEVTDDFQSITNSNLYLEFSTDVYYAMAMHWDNNHMDFEEVVDDA